MTVLLSATGLRKTFAGVSSRRARPKARGDLQVLDGLELAVHAGESVAVVGPSGAGKSTLLRVLAGLSTPDSGEVRYRGTLVTEPPEGLAVVFQDYSRSLFPWLNVERNVALPLREQGVHRAERRARVERALHAVGLEDVQRVARAYPWELSGGMQQRVALARAIIAGPQLLLLDEPFAAVDAQTRGDLQDLVLDLRRRLGLSLLTVTHDIDEAVYLADRVLILSSRPAQVVGDLRVELPQPRSQLGTRADPRFARLRIEVQRMMPRRPPIS